MKSIYHSYSECYTTFKIEELENTIETLSKGEIGILSKVKNASAAENITYSMTGGEHSVNRLRAMASAIENGLL